MRLSAEQREQNYGEKRYAQVRKSKVKKWIEKVKRKHKIRSVICLLDEYHLQFYRELPIDLISYYRKKGLHVEHIRFGTVCGPLFYVAT